MVNQRNEITCRIGQGAIGIFRNAEILLEPLQPDAFVGFLPPSQRVDGRVLGRASIDDTGFPIFVGLGDE